MELFLRIFTIIGIVLIAALALVIAVLLLLLFLPVVYRVKIKKNEDFNAAAGARWLFGAVSALFSYSKNGFDFKIRIFGVPVRKKTEEEHADKAEPAKKQPLVRAGGNIETYEKSSDNSAVFKTKTRKENDIVADAAINKVKEPEAFEENKPSVFKKLRFTFSGICDKLEKAGDLKKVFDKTKHLIFKIIKSLFPKKVSGYIKFGFDDPAMTGILVGIISALCLPLPKELKITPYFNEKKFECDIKTTGRIFIFILLFYILRMFFVKEVRELLKKTFSSSGGSKEKNRNKKK